MISDEQGQALHDKATRGGVLSADEQALLDQWYERHDREEAAVLAKASPPQTLAELRSQVDNAVAQLVTTVQSIQTLTVDNENLRREIAALHQQLARQQTSQPA